MTILNRRTFAIKPGKMREAVAVLQQAHAAYDGYDGPVRVYSSMFGDADLLQAEYEYDTLADYEAMWAAWGQSPVAAELMASMSPLEVRAHNNALRDVVAANDVDGSANRIAIRYVRWPEGPGWADVPAADIAEFVEPGEVVARLSSPHTGWWGEITLEMEFVSLADFEARQAEWMARPTSAAYNEAQIARLRPGGRVEVWLIHH